MKKTVLEKENKYYDKKINRRKVGAVVTIYTLALSIGLSATSFVLFSKFKKEIGKLPTETPIESNIPTETIEPTETPIESNIPTETTEPTETPIESNIPTETTEPTETPIESNIPTETTEPPKTLEELLLEEMYMQETSYYGNPWILEMKVNGVKKSLMVADFPDQTGSAFYFVDRFSFVPIVAFCIPSDIDNEIPIYCGIGPLKNSKVEFENMYYLNKESVSRKLRFVNFDINNYPTIGDLRKFYDTVVPESERLEQLTPYMGFEGDWNDILKWSEQYDEYIIENSNIDYTSNVTLNASSKENLNSKLKNDGLLKDINCDIVGYQKTLIYNKVRV